MAKICRDVLIKPPIAEGKDIVLRGERGGELRFSLVPGGHGTSIRLENKHKALLVDWYRTELFDNIDVLNYNGNKGELIKIQANGHEQYLPKKIIVYIISPDRQLIEYGELKWSNRCGAKKSLFEYKTKTSHHFKKVKIVCYEI